MRLKILVFTLWVVSATIAGCSPITQTPELVSSLATPFVANGVSPLPTPVDTVQPPPKGLGAVTGILIDQTQGKPYAGQYIYLAHLRKLDTADPNAGPMYFADLDIKADPNTQTDAGGHFVFPKVAPGEYALAIFLPSLQQNLLVDASTGKNIPVVIKADQITDLGTLKIIPQE